MNARRVLLRICLVLLVDLMRAEDLSTMSNATTTATKPSDGFTSTESATTPACSETHQIFVMKQIGSSEMVPRTPIKGDDLEICTAHTSCCSKKMEERYMDAVKKDITSVMHATSSYLKNLITTNAAKFQENFLEMINVSENKTHNLFSEVYQRMAAQARAPITSVYSDLKAYIQGREVDLEVTVTDFFDSLFPLVYHHSINPKLKDFSEDYKECMQATQQEIKPFGEIPRKISLHVSKSFQVARSLVQALQLGIEVINTTDHSEVSPECQKALMKLTYCPHCNGLTNVKPCNGYCINVVRGCLANVAEVDQPWNNYIASLERLAVNMKGVFNIEEVTSVLHTKISEAIMHAMETGPELSKKVKKACGHPKRASHDSAQLDEEDDDKVHNIPPKIVTNQPTNHSLYYNLQSLMRSLSPSKGFYSSLADTLCSDDSLAVRGESSCWNGETIGEYSKTVVGIGVSAQKYNPEMKLLNNQDPKISQINDKLKHIKQILMTRITPIPESDSLIVNDGSGSGWRRNNFNDDEDYYQGSGSGDSGGRINVKKHKGGAAKTPENNDDLGFDNNSTPPPKPQIPGSSSSHLSASLAILLCLSLHSLHWLCG